MGEVSESEGQLEPPRVGIVPGDWLSPGRLLGVPERRG